MESCDCHEFGKILEGRTGHTASCNYSRRKAEKAAAKPPKEKKPIKKTQSPIAKVSGKMAKLLSVYSKKKAAWIKGKRCAVELSREATEVHHQRGRVGYADQWARDNDIPLLIDERFWLPVCRSAHIEITANPEWALKEGYSLSRHERLTDEQKRIIEQNLLT